jgi:hypothetical protein
MRKLLLTALALTLSLYAEESSAQIFRLNVTNYGAGTGNTTFENFVNTEIAKIETEINKDLPSGQPRRLMEGMANSSVMAGKGIGSDYASDMSVFLIGAGVGVGADMAKDRDTGSDLSGVGIAPGVMIGFNLGFMDTARLLGMDTNRLNVYFNFMKYSLDRSINKEPGKESSAGLDMMALGTHFRYDWIRPRGTKWLGWGGVKFHFGYEYNKTNIEFKSQLRESVAETSSNGETISGTIRGNPSALIAAKTHSIPLELSTDIRLLYILSLYGGVGADYSMGEASGRGGLNADSSELSCTGGVCGPSPGTNVDVQAEANIDAKGKVNPLLFRGFAGLQVNLPYVRIFGQIDKSFGNELIGATAGVRLAF